MSLFNELFTWWNGQTLGTRLFTSRKGQKVGEDEQGNIFYETSDSKRRWVIFNGPVEASRVSADWHGWLHHTYDEAPTDVPLKRKEWERDHKANGTGSPDAYVPQGSIRTPASRPTVGGDYEAWTP
ncbi:MAG: NADH:ubiquinone oxidoreductase subunit NDUFA12 [Paracoccaceae bacterium]|jgi:NADH:ubiquinone oxidoreductase subunit|nr:NADH:ubiquinone oxidoreductase subunit NDUFA12 [Paracoccaceae bacterium]MDG1369960.1 NADH:ubiquinone oxidoreductase subunit NDUFA12 [Paracoccaceae bacterium]MDG1969644.1 NADH:ubiquinone oxidoreductase subunit NDUFA12 [Paracoccaceae bacterium]